MATTNQSDPERRGTVRMHSPRSGASAAPVVLPSSLRMSPGTSRIINSLQSPPTLPTFGQSSFQGLPHSASPRATSMIRPRSHSEHDRNYTGFNGPSRKSFSEASTAIAKAQSRRALKLNDSMVYLDGPQIYSCAQCRTHLTSHDEIISKSFHGRHGRAYLFDNCVNVAVGPAEDRLLITGMHSVSDIFCKRCNTMVGWTYAKAYELSQKYKEGKYIIEKINLHLEESDYYEVAPPAGERHDRFRARSISWGSESGALGSRHEATIYEYRP
eukprot:Nitzschia sp. Nitz4//scaffold21_size171442//38787//39751//NITZ4_002151-RA/size171442-augustus-gene-0.87-mRNA-1//-1//CDS//3329542381//1431//frame0